MTGMWPYTHGILSAAAYAGDAAAFDGVNDSLTSTSALSTGANSNNFTISWWLRFNSTAGDGVAQSILNSSGNLFDFVKTTSDQLRFNINSAGGTSIFLHDSTNTYTSTSGWVHVMASVSTALAMQIYINNSSTGVGTISTAGHSTVAMDFDAGHWTVGANVSTAQRAYADMFDPYLTISTSIDLSVAANRALFLSTALRPVSLSSDGSTVTGTAPILFLHIDDGSTVTDFATNFGSGSSFAITGSLVTSTSSPTD